MFQSFNEIADPSLARERVGRLRSSFGELGIDGFIVPRNDEFQGEYVPDCAERLRWLTGFSGSAGTSLILQDRAFMFVDGRYTLQVREQTDPALFQIHDLVALGPAAWLASHAEPGFRLGFDPWLHTVRQREALADALSRRGGRLVAVTPNPIDAIWTDRPPPPSGSIAVHPVALAGVPASAKLLALAGEIAQAGASHFIVTDPSSVAWSFNLRGADVPHTPVLLAYAILAAEGRHRLYVDPQRLPAEVATYLDELCDCRPPASIEDDLMMLARGGGTIAIDPASAASAFARILADKGEKVIFLRDPSILPRATKNEDELAGMRSAHRRDGAAVTEFLAWLANRPPDTVDEISAARWLEQCRREIGERMQMPLMDISFDTISGAGPNGAIVHYRVTEATNRSLSEGSLYLVDSGGQYTDGTTDITRTVAIGEPTPEMRRQYTLVLQGLIALSALRFPPDTRGSHIDAIARTKLWQAGLDYAHGTGHGVGAYLSVHEGPQSISRRGDIVLMPGMILSNEPGYYREGHYGIRLENLIVVNEATPVQGGDLAMHGFETLTLAPFDRRLIVRSMLSGDEGAWIDAYHARVQAEIGPLVSAETRAWLTDACRPLTS